MKSSYFSHLFIKVKDLPSIKQLFEIFGLKLVYEDGKYFRFQGSNDFYVGVEEGEKEAMENSNMEINIWVPDVKKTYKRLLDSGYEVDPPKKMPWGARHIFFADKNGINFSVYS